MAQGEYNKIKRYIQLDQLLRDPQGKTLKELFYAIDDNIGERQLRDDLKVLEGEDFGAQFLKNLYRGKERLWRYEDTDFSIFNSMNDELETLGKSIEKLRVFQGDPRFDMVRFSLMQLKNGIEDFGEPIISFQYNPDAEGLGHLEILADAILHKYPVQLNYKPFNKEAFTDNVHPYHLRQSNNRWVLFGWSESKASILNYPLDRILAVKHLSKEFRPTDIDFHEYFDDIIGTTNRADREVEDVVLRVSKRSLDYIRTKPMHRTQTELQGTETDMTLDIRLKVKLNTELEMLILSYGDAIEVLQPLELREKIRQKIKNLNDKYEV